MFKDASHPSAPSELDRSAYNAAFHEIGLPWHWDKKIYAALIGQFECLADQIQHYLNTQQPHLLKSYDASFLACLIQSKVSECRERVSAPARQSGRNLDQARGMGHQIGF